MSSEKLQSAFQKFGDLLDTRFSKEVFTTEDSVRYTFFYAISSEFELVPHDIVLESVHPNIDGHKEIDMLIPEKKDCPELVFEFKYDRKQPSGTNSPRPLKAGHLFADIFRQFRYKKEHQKSKCFLIYVTDFEQANYYQKRKIGWMIFSICQPVKHYKLIRIMSIITLILLSMRQALMKFTNVRYCHV